MKISVDTEAAQTYCQVFLNLNFVYLYADFIIPCS